MAAKRQLLSAAAVLAVVFAGCGGSSPTCEDLYNPDMPQYTACLMVDDLNELHAAYPGDKSKVATEMVKRQDVWLGSQRFDALFNDDAYCTSYEFLFSQFKTELTQGNFNPKGAWVDHIEVSNQWTGITCNITPVKAASVEVTLDDGAGFPITTLVRVDDRWYVLTLLWTLSR